MAQAIALARSQVALLPVVEMARVVIVAGCAMALVFAGQALPF